MAAVVAIAGTLGNVATIIKNLREVFKRAGIEPKDIARISSELMKRLRGGRSERGEGAPVPSPWEYSVVKLSEKRSRGRTKSVLPILRDGVEVPPTDLAAYLNQMSAEGWEMLSTIGSEEAPTLILVRPRPTVG